MKKKQKQLIKQQLIKQQEQQNKNSLIDQITVRISDTAERQQARQTLSAKTSDELEQIVERIQMALQEEVLHIAYVNSPRIRKGLLTAKQEELRLFNAAASAVVALGLLEAPDTYRLFDAVKQDIERSSGSVFTMENVVKALILHSWAASQAPGAFAYSYLFSNTPWEFVPGTQFNREAI